MRYSRHNKYFDCQKDKIWAKYLAGLTVKKIARDLSAGRVGNSFTARQVKYLIDCMRKEGRTKPAL